MTVSFVKAKLLDFMKHAGIELSIDGNCSISRAEFETLLLLPEGAKIIGEVDVDSWNLNTASLNIKYIPHVVKDTVVYIAEAKAKMKHAETPTIFIHESIAPIYLQNS